jgi:hypothetical protein
VQIDTAQFKFGSSSLLVAGFSPTLQFNGSADWDLSDTNSDQFTIECWVRFIDFALPGGYGLFVGRELVNWDWEFGVIMSGGFPEFFFRCSSDGSTITVNLVSSGAALLTGVWYHLAVDKDSLGKIRLYRNGVPMGSVTPADSSIHNSTYGLKIGAGNVGGGAPMHGWLDEVRITKGIARYKTDAGFTPPTAAFPRGGTP